MDNRYLYKIVDADTKKSVWRWFPEQLEVGASYNGTLNNQDATLFVEELIFKKGR